MISELFCMMFLLSSKTVEEPLEQSEFVTIVMTVPETHAAQVREAMGQAGAGRVGNYSHCSFSMKGIGRFRPEEGAKPFLGKEGKMETVVEERIETVVQKDLLEKVLEAIKKAHPYEETVIDIYPVYKMGRKTQKESCATYTPISGAKCPKTGGLRRL